MSERITTWITGYRRAWESNDPDDIRAIFTEDAAYRTEPYADAWQGHDEIVEGWLEAADEPGETTFDWSPLIENDELSVVQAVTTYDGGPTYSNLWVIRFDDDGRANDFTEWYMAQPADE